MILWAGLPGRSVRAQVIPQPDTVEILAPLPGEAIQGNYPIPVTISVDGFQEAILSFRYTADPTGSWFELAKSPIQLTEEELVTWDTTALTDGDYTLQLVILRGEDEPLVYTLPGIRVRNYSIIETDTPAPTFTPRPDANQTPVATETPAPESAATTPTPLPRNPAEVTPATIGASLLQGVAFTLIAFLVVGALLVIRSMIRR